MNIDMTFIHDICTHDMVCIVLFNYIYTCPFSLCVYMTLVCIHFI